MNKRRKSVLIRIAFLALAFGAIAGAIAMVMKHDVPAWLRITGGSFFVLFVPGFIATFIFFPKHARMSDEFYREAHVRSSLDAIERCVLAVLLSVIITSFAVYILYITPGIGWTFDLRGFMYSITSLTGFVLIVAILKILWRNRKSRSI